MAFFITKIICRGNLALLLAGLTCVLPAQEPVIPTTPATLPLADGAKVVIQGIRRYVDPQNGSAKEDLSAGYVRPVNWTQYPGNPQAPHLLAQDAVPTAANIFTVTVVPKPATFPVAKSAGPDCQFIVLKASNGNYLCFLDDDMLGANAPDINGAEILLLDRGEAFKLYVSSVPYGRQQALPVFSWPSLSASQLLFCKVDDVTHWQFYPPIREKPATAGDFNLYLVVDPAASSKSPGSAK
jgi:hypothetical protein